MVSVALIGLPIIFPYSLKPHADKSDNTKSTMVIPI